MVLGFVGIIGIHLTAFRISRRTLVVTSSPPQKMSDTPGSSVSKVARWHFWLWLDQWMKLLESNRNTSQQLTYRLIYKLSMLSIHGSILYPPSRIALKVALRQREFAYTYICDYIYNIYVYNLLVRNVLRQFPAPKTCSTAFTSSFKAADICRTSCCICQLF